MKIFTAFAVFLAIGFCDGQTNPIAWGRDQRSRSGSLENNNEASINTDRLMSSIESRISSIVRSETSALKQQLIKLEQSNGRLENTISSLRTDVNDLKEMLDDIREERIQVQDLSKEDQNSSRNDKISQKLDNLGLLINTVRSSVNKIEKEVVVVKNHVRTSSLRNNQPQFALVPSRDETFASQSAICTANDPNTDSGIRKVRPNFYAFCEMDDEDANGWIVIQNRYDGLTDFFRTWNEYKQGFGNIAGEFWMGLDKIYELTSSKLHELMIVMEDFNDVRKVAKYSAFAISDESSFYSLNILGSFSGDADDSLKYHAGMKFSTFDNDNDAWADGNCARSHYGGWWYNSCDESNLNGRYFEYGKVEAANKYQGIYWSTFTGSLSSLRSVKMMIRQVDAQIF